MDNIARKYVIIGNSAAAVGAVEGIRRTDRENCITIITDEEYHTYSRPLISYYLLGKVSEEKTKYRDSDFYIKNNVEFISGVKAVQIDNEKKLVILGNNARITYDKLLVATGSSPFIPPFKGLETVKHKFTFMSLEDAKSLEKVIDKDKNVLIVGAGLIGLKCAEGILKRVKSVTVADLAPCVLSSILDAESSEIVQKKLEAAGINLKLSCGVESFSDNTAELSSGEKIDFDILVLAVGVRANTSLLAGIADIEKGIIINEKCETSFPDIYSAGDCTQSTDISSGMSRIMALLPNAYMQGECAGMNMAGGERVFDKAFPMNSIGFFGLHIITAGSYDGEVFFDSKSGCKKLFYRDNCLKGFILVGEIEKAGIYTNLIREQTPLSEIDFELICEKPSLIAFSRAERLKKLGGAV